MATISRYYLAAAWLEVERHRRDVKSACDRLAAVSPNGDALTALEAAWREFENQWARLQAVAGDAFEDAWVNAVRDFEACRTRLHCAIVAHRYAC